MVNVVLALGARFVVPTLLTMKLFEFEPVLVMPRRMRLVEPLLVMVNVLTVLTKPM